MGASGIARKFSRGSETFQGGGRNFEIQDFPYIKSFFFGWKIVDFEILAHPLERFAPPPGKFPGYATEIDRLTPSSEDITDSFSAGHTTRPSVMS